MTRCTVHEPVHSTSSDPSDTAGYLRGVEILAAYEIKQRGFLTAAADAWAIVLTWMIEYSDKHRVEHTSYLHIMHVIFSDSLIFSQINI